MASKFRRILFGAGFPVAMPTTPSKSRAERAKSLELPVALRAHVKTHREARDVA